MAHNPANKIVSRLQFHLALHTPHHLLVVQSIVPVLNVVVAAEHCVRRLDVYHGGVFVPQNGTPRNSNWLFETDGSVKVVRKYELINLIGFFFNSGQRNSDSFFFLGGQEEVNGARAK